MSVGWSFVWTYVNIYCFFRDLNRSFPYVMEAFFNPFVSHIQMHFCGTFFKPYKDFSLMKRISPKKSNCLSHIVYLWRYTWKNCTSAFNLSYVIWSLHRIFKWIKSKTIKQGLLLLQPTKEEKIRHTADINDKIHIEKLSGGL